MTHPHLKSTHHTAGTSLRHAGGARGYKSGSTATTPAPKKHHASSSTPTKHRKSPSSPTLKRHKPSAPARAPTHKKSTHGPKPVTAAQRAEVVAKLQSALDQMRARAMGAPTNEPIHGRVDFGKPDTGATDLQGSHGGGGGWGLHGSAKGGKSGGTHRGRGGHKSNPEDHKPIKPPHHRGGGAHHTGGGGHTHHHTGSSAILGRDSHNYTAPPPAALPSVQLSHRGSTLQAHRPTAGRAPRSHGLHWTDNQARTFSRHHS